MIYGRYRNHRQQVRRVGVRIEMTALADIGFLILTFFFYIHYLARPQTLEVTVPDSHAIRDAWIMDCSPTLTVRINERNDLYWNLGLDPPHRVDPAGMHRVLAGLAGNSVRPRAILKVSRHARYEMMVNTLDDLRASNVRQLSFAPYTRSDSLIIARGKITDIAAAGKGEL